MSYKRNGPPPKNAVRPAPPPGPPLTFSQKMREREVVALERLSSPVLSPDDVASGCRKLGYVTNSQASVIRDLVDYLQEGLSVDEAINRIYQDNAHDRPY